MGLTSDHPSSWSPGERVEECVCGERSHGELFAWPLWPFPRKSSSEETQVLHRVRCSFPRKSWTPYGAAGAETLPGAAGNGDSHRPCLQLLVWTPLKACPKAVTAFVMAGTSHTQEVPMPQRSTSPKLAAQTELCAGDLNPAISTQTWPPAHWPQVAGNSLQNNPQKNAI